MLFCERETYVIQSFPDCIEKVDKQIKKGLGRDSDEFWEIVKDIIVERLTRKPKRKRMAIA
jgi:hypothetical protein